MKLVDLKPCFMRYETRAVDPTQFVDGVMHPDGIERTTSEVCSLADAHGIRFLCPKCFAAQGGVIGVHSVMCWFRGRVPDDVRPAPGRWTPQGTGFDDLSFVPGDPPMAHSVLLLGGCAWHGFVTRGEVT